MATPIFKKPIFPKKTSYPLKGLSVKDESALGRGCYFNYMKIFKPKNFSFDFFELIEINKMYGFV